MNNHSKKKIVAKTGDRVKLTYADKEFEVIIIDPNGLGQEQPSVGLGFRMTEKYIGIPNDTLSKWTYEDTSIKGAGQKENKLLELPSGKCFRVLRITGNDSNTYTVIEVSDWFSLAIDLLINLGKLGKPAKEKIGSFVSWFAVKGFYAEAYTAIKGTYTKKDSRATTRWLQLRQDGKYTRKEYTDLLQEQGCIGNNYAYWTDLIYVGLFDLTAKEMKEVWECVDGSRKIARNYISKENGLLAVKSCEELVVKLFAGNLNEAHQVAINFTRRKYLN